MQDFPQSNFYKMLLKTGFLLSMFQPEEMWKKQQLRHCVMLHTQRGQCQRSFSCDSSSFLIN